jgi:DNA-binding response OmpR family regulator
MTTGDLLSFGPYLLDTHTRRLTRDGADVRLAARQLELLCLLARVRVRSWPKTRDSRMHLTPSRN